MIFSRDYSRAILNLKPEEGASSDRFGIFGRIVIEIKAGKGEIMLYAKGIEGGKAGSLYLICQRGERLIPLKAVLVNINEGSAALKWRFNPDNISGSSLKIEDVRVIAVMTKEGRPLLSAFCGKPFKWTAGEVFSAGVHLEETNAGKTSFTEVNKPEIKAAEAEPKTETGPKEKTDEKSEAAEAPKAEDEREPDERVLKFTEVVNRFRKDLDELRLYAFNEKWENEERKRAEKPRNGCLDTDYLFRERPEYMFKDLGGYFVKISPNDLCLIDDHMYKYAGNPTVRAAYLRFGYLLLGKAGPELFFCVPDEKREFGDAESLGFTDFKETGENRGFRIMKIAKENEYENPKEKLDRGRT